MYFSYEYICGMKQEYTIGRLVEEFYKKVIELHKPSPDQECILKSKQRILSLRCRSEDYDKYSEEWEIISSYPKGFMEGLAAGFIAGINVNSDSPIAKKVNEEVNDICFKLDIPVF